MGMLLDKLIQGVQPPDPRLSDVYDRLSDVGVTDTSMNSQDSVYRNQVSEEALLEEALRNLQSRLIATWSRKASPLDITGDEHDAARAEAENLLDIIVNDDAFNWFSKDEKRSYIENAIAKWQSSRRDPF